MDYRFINAITATVNASTSPSITMLLLSTQLIAEDESLGELWEVIYMSVVLFLTFGALISDKIGADLVMISALTLCLASGIISMEERTAGFSNEGLLTVLAMFVVAAGINHTGALDWYMGKMLGRPKSVAIAQLQLMIPIAIVSEFLNNTPVVVVMIPIVQRWGGKLGVSPKQLLIPLSFASILGGTCSLIGASTNLVVFGLLEQRYPDNDPIALFDLSVYDVPIAMAGISYILIFSPILLPSSPADADGSSGTVLNTILLGARLMQWSPAAGRNVKSSGLRDTGGIYLVNVYRHETGNVHRAVGQDFVLNVGDILYFTSGFPESFATFCDENGLEVVINEVEEDLQNNDDANNNSDTTINTASDHDDTSDAMEKADLESTKTTLSKSIPPTNLATPPPTAFRNKSLYSIDENSNEDYEMLGAG